MAFNFSNDFFRVNLPYVQSLTNNINRLRVLNNFYVVLLCKFTHSLKSHNYSVRNGFRHSTKQGVEC